MFDYIACPQCGEPTEEFPDGVCPSCSLQNQMELDEILEEHDQWNKLSEAQKDRAIRHAINYVEHYTEPEDDDDLLESYLPGPDPDLESYGDECREF